MLPRIVTARERRRGGPRFRRMAVFDLLHEHMMTEKMLAQRVGHKRRAITAWATGTNEPSFATVALLAEQFGKPLSFFVECPKAAATSPAPSAEPESEV